jgi:hypothetical protein
MVIDLSNHPEMQHVYDDAADNARKKKNRNPDAVSEGVLPKLHPLAL